ncbi:MAG: hypothetical protein EOO77_13955, partial [Oxalobacteraceae bacterium]
MSLVIPLISNTTAVFQGTPILKYKINSDTTLYPVTPAPSLVAGQTFNAQILWSTLCDKFAGSSGCTVNPTGTVTFSIGIDNDNDGDFEEKLDFNIKFRYVTGPSPGTTCVPPAAPTNLADGVCYYKVMKGDEKVYITDFAASDNAMSTQDADIKFDRMVMFYAAGAPSSPAAVTPASPSHVLTIQNNGASIVPGIADRRIRGLV